MQLFLIPGEPFLSQTLCESPSVLHVGYVSPSLRKNKNIVVVFVVAITGNVSFPRFRPGPEKSSHF